MWDEHKEDGCNRDNMQKRSRGTGAGRVVTTLYSQIKDAQKPQGRQLANMYRDRPVIAAHSPGCIEITEVWYIISLNLLHCSKWCHRHCRWLKLKNAELTLGKWVILKMFSSSRRMEQSHLPIPGNFILRWSSERQHFQNLFLERPGKHPHNVIKNKL